jgi:hypothetical protein
VSHKFGYVVASFSLNSKKSLISFFIPSLTKVSSTQGATGIYNPIGGTTIWTTQYSPERMSLAAYVSEVVLIGHQWKERPIGRANFICLSTGKWQGQEVGVGG